MKINKKQSKPLCKTEIYQEVFILHGFYITRDFILHRGSVVLINGINRIINGITWLIDSLTRLINGWGPGRGFQQSITRARPSINREMQLLNRLMRITS